MATSEQKEHATVSSRGGRRRNQPIQGHDNMRVQRMGKKPVLKRNFGNLSIFGLSYTHLGTWKGPLGTFIASAEVGGSGGTVYAFIFGWACAAAIFVVLAPTAGGQYHWASMLAPVKYQKFLRYISGISYVRSRLL
ncbi:hypothetical protein BBP40_009323 [Aspergillus hancockii]|nr:hypothetical protein BBP40_009323 [Aspergillus hancockii]